MFKEKTYDVLLSERYKQNFNIWKGLWCKHSIRFGRGAYLCRIPSWEECLLHNRIWKRRSLFTCAQNDWLMQKWYDHWKKLKIHDMEIVCTSFRSRTDFDTMPRIGQINTMEDSFIKFPYLGSWVSFFPVDTVCNCIWKVEIGNWTKNSHNFECF